MNITIEQLEAAIAAANEKLAELKAAEATQAEKAWPQNNHHYWFVDTDGRTDTSRWASDRIDAARMAIGNVFRTEEDAEREAERRKVLTRLRQLERESWGDGKADWKNTRQDKWYLFFSHHDGTWNTERYTSVQDQGSVYFATEEAARAAVETIGAERLMLLLED